MTIISESIRANNVLLIKMLINLLKNIPITGLLPTGCGIATDCGINHSQCPLYNVLYNISKIFLLPARLACVYCISI